MARRSRSRTKIDPLCLLGDNQVEVVRRCSQGRPLKGKNQTNVVTDTVNNLASRQDRMEGIMGEVQESVNSLNQFLANLIGHQNPVQTLRDKDVPNRSPEGVLPIPHDEGLSRQPVKAAQFEQLSGDEPSPTQVFSRRLHYEIHGTHQGSLSQEYQGARGAQRNQQAYVGHNVGTKEQRKVRLRHNAAPAMRGRISTNKLHVTRSCTNRSRTTRSLLARSRAPRQSRTYGSVFKKLGQNTKMEDRPQRHQRHDLRETLNNRQDRSPSVSGSAISSVRRVRAQPKGD